MDNDKNEGWLEGIIAKRTPDVLLVLSQLVEAGLSHGFCTANDIKTRDLREPNVIGATFKTLRGLGFRQLDERVDAKHESMHGRKVHKWTLDEPQKARAFLNMVRQALTGHGLCKPQMELF